MTIRELFVTSWDGFTAFLSKYVVTLLTPHKWLDTEVWWVAFALLTYFALIKLFLEWVYERHEDQVWWRDRYGSTWPFWYLFFTADSLQRTFIFLAGIVFSIFVGLSPLIPLKWIGIPIDPFEDRWEWVTWTYLLLVWLCVFYCWRKLTARIDAKIEKILLEIDPLFKLDRFNRTVTKSD